MTRHLLPNEIDLMVDGDAGFGLAPLRAHVAECEECRARIEALRAIVDALDTLPHFAPRREFADAVMAKVQVIEPWHVALTETVRRLVPSGTPMRLLAAAGAGMVAVAVSGSALWLALRVDLATWAFNLFLDRGREAVLGAVQTAAPGGLGALAAGVTLLAASALAAVAGFRRLAVASRAKRS